MYVFTKFHEDKGKIVDFVLIANFRAWELFSYSPSTYKESVSTYECVTSYAVNCCWQDKCECMSLEMTGYTTHHGQMHLNTTPNTYV